MGDAHKAAIRFQGGYEVAQRGVRFRCHGRTLARRSPNGYRRPPANLAASGCARSRAMAMTPTTGPMASTAKA